jgi:hypothetical protein
VAFSGGVAQCSFAAGLPSKPLSYTVTATLQDPNLKSPGGGSLVQQVSPASTSTDLSGLPGSLVASQGFSFHITVNTTAPGTGSPSGDVEWAACLGGTTTCPYGGSVLLPTPTATDIANNQNKITISLPGGMPPGFYDISASYVGTANWKVSNSALGHILVSKVPTTSSLVLSRNPIANGAALGIRDAIIADPKATGSLGAPTGTVTFTITDANGNTLTCESGSNTITISTNSKDQGIGRCIIAAGQLSSTASPYQVQASYSGDSNYKTSSATDTLTVNP